MIAGVEHHVAEADPREPGVGRLQFADGQQVGPAEEFGREPVRRMAVRFDAADVTLVPEDGSHG